MLSNDKANKPRKEVLWMNFNPGKQMSLYDNY